VYLSSPYEEKIEVDQVSQFVFKGRCNISKSQVSLAHINFDVDQRGKGGERG
jgi:hypothetical protein